MTMDPANTGAPNLIERAKNILMQPKAEWDRIAAEPTSVNQLYIGYVLPLVALAAICSFIGLSVIGASAFGVSYRVPMVAGLVSAVLQVVMGLVGVYVMALITNALAPNFGSVQNQEQAHKLAAYGSTAGFLAGVFSIFPPIAILGILGLYSLVLIYLGLPRLMKTPEDKRIGYFLTIIVIMIVFWIVIGMVVGAVQRAIGGVPGAPSYTFGQNAPSTMQGEVTLPGGGTVDLGELQRQAEAMQGGAAGVTIDPARVQAQLPQSLPGGFTLASTSSGAAMGMSQAEGVYRNGDAELRLSVMQTGAMGALAGMAAGMNVQENRQDGDGYARTQTIDGRIYSEEVNNAAGSASYSVVGRGVAVTVEGTNVTLDQARAAVDTIGVQRLEREFGA